MGNVKLKKVFNTINLPQETDLFEFCAAPIPLLENHRLAKDKFGNPVLLLFAIDKSISALTPNIKLQNISVEFNIKCKIKQKNTSFGELFTVLRFIGQDASLQDYFLKLSNDLIEVLGNLPTQKQIKDEIYQIIELLRFASEPPKKTVQGLWSELFLISISPNPTTLLSCWHSTPEEKFDFNNGKERIEVKSSSSGLRIHNFSIEQLNPPGGTIVFIASLFVVSSGNGISIQDLEEQIAAKTNGKIDLINKLRRLIAKTLGNSIQEGVLLKFDFQVAQESLRFYRVEDVPRILLSSIPNMITQVKFKSNLEESKPINYIKILRDYFN